MRPQFTTHTYFWFQNKILYKPLAEIDPEIQNIIDKETWRQFTGLELIASEVSPMGLLSTSNKGPLLII